MGLWVVRAGKYGENEPYALDNGVVVIGWEELGDLSPISDRESLQKLMDDTYPDEKDTTTRVWTGEVWALRERMKIGDLVAIPLKTRSALAVGRITGPYRYTADAPTEAKHQRAVEWIRTDLSRSELDQDILFSLGSSLAVFQVTRNDADTRVAALLSGRRIDHRVDDLSEASPKDTDAAADLEQLSRDQIVSHIARKFRGHDLARLVAGVLQSQGYKVQVSPPGADGGVDIIAGTGPLGFDMPRLAAQVKSSDTPSDVSVLRELQGVMPRFGAQQGLIVSWGGFRESVIREARQLYFQVRLWDAGDLVAAIQANYERLPDDLQAEMQLKRIWILVTE